MAHDSGGVFPRGMHAVKPVRGNTNVTREADTVNAFRQVRQAGDEVRRQEAREDLRERRVVVGGKGAGESFPVVSPRRIP